MLKPQRLNNNRSTRFEAGGVNAHCFAQKFSILGVFANIVQNPSLPEAEAGAEAGAEMPADERFTFR